MPSCYNYVFTNTPALFIINVTSRLQGASETSKIVPKAGSDFVAVTISAFGFRLLVLPASDVGQGIPQGNFEAAKIYLKMEGRTSIPLTIISYQPASPTTVSKMRLKLYLEVLLLRILQWIGTFIDRHFISPKGLRPSFTVKVPSKISSRRGKIPLYFYLPTGWTRSKLAQASKKDWPLIVNFHGGAFTIGHPTDDFRWASALLSEINAVFVSVGYRMGPKYSQPTAVEDCVDALRWLWAHAEDYGFDPSHTILTGFSAGGNLCFTTPLRHGREKKVDSDGTLVGSGKNVAGIVAFYPSVDQSIPRQQKVDSNPISKTKGAEPPWLHRIVDESYYQNLPPEGRASLNLSPALAPKEALQNDLPNQVAIFTCEYDKLLVEGEDFRKTLKRLGKRVGGEMVSDVQHGFDKKPGNRPAQRDQMYRQAIKLIKGMM
jgi:putative ergosteryl-3beta-O-L-aspartate hydrolase